MFEQGAYGERGTITAVRQPVEGLLGDDIAGGWKTGNSTLGNCTPGNSTPEVKTSGYY
jgi:hypothetical protein